MRRLMGFLRYRRSLLLYYVCTAALFLLVTFLTDLPRITTRYLLLLMTVTLLTILLIDGIRYAKTRRALRAAAADMRLVTERLPAPSNAVEAQCFALLGALNADNASLRQRIDKLQSEQIGYYTLWVHQVKTPIAAMRLVLADMDGQEAAELMQSLFKIEQYADLALRYAKLSDIASDLVVAPCELSEVVRESAKKFAVVFIYKKLLLRVQPMQREVITDRRWLGFILEQICSNAVKYTQTGGVEIALSGNRLSVSDTGVGIRAEDLPRIFEKGYTGYNGRMDTRASGIGLYLAKKAADALHIEICVESVLGSGTKVTLLLPDAEPVLE